MNRRHLFTSLTVFLGLLLSSFGQSSAELKSRMSKRLPAMDALRAAGKVGENNKGQLTAKQKLSTADATLLLAENKDRKAVYTIIAKRSKESVAVVGQKRAATIRKLAKKGIWLQDEKGKWVRKR